MIKEIFPGDFGRVAELESRCFGSPWSEEMIGSVYNEFSTVACDFDGDTVIGYIFFTTLFEDAEILRICVDKSERRKGIGAGLIGYCAEKAKAAGCTSIFLEVRRENSSAVGLYEKAGFVKISERKAYYGNGEDALIYELKIEK